MRAITYAVLLAGLAASMSLGPSFVHAGGWADASLNAIPSGQFGIAHAQQAPDQLPFVTTWQTDAANQAITIPIEGSGMTIHWGDGAVSTSVSGTVAHTYVNPGTYQVSVYGGLEAISLDGHPDATKIVSIDQWGDASWTTMRSAFSGATNMVYEAIDIPDLSRVTDMSDMFRGASSFNGDISSWDVSSVTDMSWMFSGASSFNRDISSWDVSSVTGMRGMFGAAASFNQPLDTWDVSSVTDIPWMFARATSFNQPLDTWDVSSVTYTGGMFFNAASFNQPLDTWDVSSVTDMSGMFERATSFNRDISAWDVSSVTSMSGMFAGATSFNQPLNTWNTSSVTDTGGMFFNATSFNQPLDTWDVSSVTDMTWMFEDAATFNQPLDSWDVSSVAYMPWMFSGATSFNGDISSWDVSSVTDMTGMFANATSFDRNLGAWYVMMDSASIDRADIPGVIGTISARNPFLNGQSPTYVIEPGGDSDRFAITDGNQLSMASAAADRTTYEVTIAATGDSVFEDGNNRRTIQVTLVGDPHAQQAPDQLPFVTTWRTDAANQTVTIPLVGSGMTIHWGDGTSSTGVAGAATHRYANPGTYQVSVYGGLEAISLNYHPDASKLVSVDQWGDASWTTMRSAFRGATDMVYRATDAPDLSRVTDMSRIFANAASFDGNISSWNVSSVTDMSQMFWGASSFNQPLGSWDVSSVTDVRGMFHDAASFNQPLGSWDVSSVTDMYDMFSYATSFNQPLGSWDVSSVTDMDWMFWEATSFNGNISAWDVSSVTDMSSMFARAYSFNQNISAWNVSSVTDMSYMFWEATSFDQPLHFWDASSVTDMTQMFDRATSFDRNLGSWYVVIDSASINRADVPGVVGTISAQNPFLDNQNPTYMIGPGGDSDRFEITGGNQLSMVSADADRTAYAVTIIATGDSVFGDGNNRRTVQVTLVG